MAKVFALFEDAEALNQAKAQMGASGAEVIPPALPDPNNLTDTGQGMHEAYAGKAPLDSAKLVEGYTLEDDLQRKGIRAEDARLFADALRSGASVLVLSGERDALEDRLREAGASHVASSG